MLATLQAVQPFQLHGVLYYQLAYVPDGDAEAPPPARVARVSHDMVYADPQPGDRVDVRAILGVVDRIERAPEAQP